MVGKSLLRFHSFTSTVLFSYREQEASADQPIHESRPESEDQVSIHNLCDYMCPALQSFSVIRNKENEVLILISGIGCPLKGQMGLCGSDKFTNIRTKTKRKTV